jgi:two-component system sensor kinase FixL
LAEATFEGIAITEGGIVVDGNPQLGALFGGSIEEILGRPLMDLVAPESRELVSRRIREGYEEAYEFSSMRLDGSTFPSEAHARNRHWHGRDTRVTALRDLTSVKQAAEQLQAQRIQLEHVRQMSLVSEISAGVLHQIVQPLTAATNHTAVAKLKVSRCEVHRCGCLPLLEQIEGELSGARRTIAHIRALANPAHLLRGRVGLSDLVLGLEALLRDEAKTHGFEITFACAADLPPVEVDRVQIEQVIFNLVRNAFEAGADLGRERRVVRLSTQMAGKDGVEFRVRDSGPGIAAEIRTLLFTPFFTTKAEGTGIGLRLSQTIITAHGGSICGANNTDGPGATFSFILPSAPGRKRT